MRSLLVLRHAHARRAAPGMDDHERPLSERGERDARRMGRRLRGEDLVPDVVIASTAVRARDTARLAAEAGDFADRMETSDQLYEAEPEDGLDVVRAHGATADRVMIVGHNPAFQELVRGAGDGIEAMPTGAVAMVAVDAPAWEELDPEACYLVRIMVPEEGG